MAGVRTQLARGKRKATRSWYQLLDALLDSDRAWQYTYRLNGLHTADYRFQPDQIMFVHLPKTGGTTFAKVFEAAPEGLFAHLHIHKAVSKHCPPGTFRYITTMRNPVDRVWSQYQHVLRYPEGADYRKFALRGLETFLQKCPAVRNYAVQYYAANMNGAPDEHVLRQAQHNLAQFETVIDFRNIATEITVLAERLKVPCNLVPNERKASYAGPTAAERALIVQYNALDLKLYETWEAGLAST